MKKLNCWQYKHCGREAGGKNAHELGICPATMAKEVDTLHGGVNGGRCCWAVTGTLCEGKVQGSVGAKTKNCLKCEFFQLVSQEEGNDLVGVDKIIALLNRATREEEGAGEMERSVDPRTRKKLTVLVVDDSVSVRYALCRQLEERGLRVIEAKNGREAVSKTLEFKPDIVTLDVSMPEMDGFAACAAIRQTKEGENLPIVFVTGNDTMADRERGFKLGALDFISKRSENFWQAVISTVEKILRPKVTMGDLTALVIDNDPVSLWLLSTTLEQQGINILRAVEMTSARQIAAENHLDMIICEANSSEIDGVALCQHFRRQPQLGKIPIILLCAETLRMDILNYFEAGATDYLIKPFPREELLARLLVHIETQQLLKRLASEATKNKLILDSAGDGIVGLDTTGKVTFVNPAGARILGWLPEQLRGQEFHLLTHHTDGSGRPFAPERCPIVNSYCHGTVVTVADDLFWRQDGTSLVVKYVSTPIYEGDNIGGAVVAFNDITLQKQDEELRQDVERITRHDLKSPLNGIINIPALLLNDANLTDKQRLYLTMLRDSGYRMLKMINESLNMFKMEKGFYDFNPEPVDLLAVLAQILVDLSLIKDKGLRVAIVVDGEKMVEGRPFLVLGEELLCYTMLANLLMNAVEASPLKAEIAISLRRVGAWAEIAMHNEGVVPEGIRATFFHKYATSGKSGGTGLGTYSAKLIAETQKGKIRMDSEAVGGTTIFLTLPLAG